MVGLNTNNQITVPNNSNHLALSITLSNGWIRGTFNHLDRGLPASIRGVILQESNQALGFYRYFPSEGSAWARKIILRPAEVIAP